ncbi:MAG: DUF2281 domain-containing protein [Spirulina sp. SIO3F2]|nr:DUF2281 domain-containing protein [Spirulina sp. SIO3F2]
MTLKEELINELDQIPEPLIQEVLDFLQFLKSKQNSSTQTISARTALQKLVMIGQRQQPCDAVQICRESRDELEIRCSLQQFSQA